VTDIPAEFDLAGTLKYEYIFFNGQRVARRDGTTNPTAYYISDHLQSTTVVTNSTGAVQNDSDYFAYGGEIVLSNAVPQNYKFNGKERDGESGLDEFGARYFANAYGRFMQTHWSAKPAAVPYANYGNPQSLNLFAYVENNPTTFGDPDGHCGDVRGGLCDGSVTGIGPQAAGAHEPRPALTIQCVRSCKVRSRIFRRPRIAFVGRKILRYGNRRKTVSSRQSACGLGSSLRRAQQITQGRGAPRTLFTNGCLQQC